MLEMLLRATPLHAMGALGYIGGDSTKLCNLLLVLMQFLRQLDP